MPEQAADLKKALSRLASWSLSRDASFQSERRRRNVPAVAFFLKLSEGQKVLLRVVSNPLVFPCPRLRDLVSKNTAFFWILTMADTSAETSDSGRFFELLAMHVASGKTIRAAADLCGCSERQGYRISATPEFRQRVSEIRSAAIDASVGEITSATTLAVRTLVALLDDPHSALGAAKAILSNVAPLSELGELRQRLDKLERGE